MNANDTTIPMDDVSWVDYCDALASEAWLESRKENLLTKKPAPRVEFRDDGKSTRFPMST